MPIYYMYIPMILIIGIGVIIFFVIRNKSFKQYKNHGLKKSGIKTIGIIKAKYQEKKIIFGSPYIDDIQSFLTHIITFHELPKTTIITNFLAGEYIDPQGNNQIFTIIVDDNYQDFITISKLEFNIFDNIQEGDKVTMYLDPKNHTKYYIDINQFKLGNSSSD